MLLAVLTDLHANREALEACLAHAQERSADQYAFLGDLVGYGADPAWVIDTVMAYVNRGAYVLMGNHDLGVLQDGRKDMNPNARFVVEWTRQQLDQGQLDFIRDLPMQFEIEDNLLCMPMPGHPTAGNTSMAPWKRRAACEPRMPISHFAGMSTPQVCIT